MGSHTHACTDQVERGRRSETGHLDIRDQMTDTLINEHGVPCGCGRSATGFCTGLHALSDEEWDARVFDEAFVNEEKHKNEHES